MSSANPESFAKDFIAELVFCLNQEDIVKAKALLQFASDSSISTDVQKKAMTELAKGPERVVLPLIEYLTKVEISDPKIQEALYELILDKAYGNTDLVIAYITKNEKKARLLFLKAAGELCLMETAPILKQIISTDKDPQIIGAAIQSLGALRLPESLDTFGHMAVHPDREVKKSAIFAISKTGSQEAVDLIMGFLGEDEQTNKLAVEALAERQDLYALEQLTSLLSSPTTIVRDTAIVQLLKLGTKSTPILTRAFKNAQADYLVHLMTTLGYIGDPAAIIPILDIINTQPKDANIRQAAYEAMERIPSPQTFDRPEDAIPQILATQPDLVITDLNMPNISGLELTRALRKKFTRQQVPVLMITTQSDFVEEENGDMRVDDTILTKSGINIILHKPFTDDDFKQAITRFLAP